MSILESGVQNVGGTAPRMGIFEMGMIALASGPDFDRTQTILPSGSVIVEMNCIGHCQRPQRLVKVVWPSDCSMKHEDSGSA